MMVANPLAAPSIATVAVSLPFCLLAVLAGVGFNLLLKLSLLEEQGSIVSPWSYVGRHPYRSLTLAIAAIATTVLLYGAGQMTYATAFVIGVAADLAADRMRERAAAAIAKLPPNP